MDPHPITRYYPELGDEDYARLLESVRDDGLLEPIVLLDGKILDGRARYRACLELGCDYRTVEFADLGLSVDPEEYLYSKVFACRNLSKKDKVDAILRVAPKTPLKEIAKRAGCTDRYVRRLSCLLENDAELYDKHMRGELSLHRAEDQLANRAQVAVTEAGVSRNPRFVEAHRNYVYASRAVNQIHLAIRSLSNLNEELSGVMESTKIQTTLLGLVDELRMGEPIFECPKEGPHDETCECGGREWITRAQYEEKTS